MNKTGLFLGIILCYSIIVAFYSLLLTVIIMGSIDLVFYCLHFPMLPFKGWMCSYTVIFITMFITEIKVFIELYNKERAEIDG